MAVMPDDSNTHAYVGKTSRPRAETRSLRPTAKSRNADGKVSNVFSIATTAPRPLGQGGRWFSRQRAGSRSGNRLYVLVRTRILP